MTIDINELRRLAQAATAGPWKAGQYLGSLRQFVIHTDVGDKGRGSDVAFTSAAFGNDETIANARLIAAANPAAISDLIDRLEATEKEREIDEQRIADLMVELNRVGHENDALRARIEAMEQQEPYSYIYEYANPIDGSPVWRNAPGYWNAQYPRSSKPLYTLPGAKGEEK